MHKVSILRCNSYDGKEVRKALDASLKNIDFSFKKNLKVLIKPNLLSPHLPKKAITTHPVILEELCKILKKQNADIYIGESSSYDTNLAFRLSGIGQLGKYAKIINFEGEDKEFVDFNSMKRVPLPKILREVDLIINIAKLKTHILTGVSLCVKNLYGCIPGKLKTFYHRALPSPENFSMLLFELHEQIKPQLNIIDGVIGIEGNGPGTSGDVINSKVIIAGKNASATDIIASEVMGFNLTEIYTNNFSNIKREDIEIIGEKNLKLNFKKPSSGTGPAVPVFHFINGLFPKPKITFNHAKCSQCHLCEKKCPVNAIKLEPFPECAYDKCIKCCCCIEVCPNSAISLEEYWAKELAKKSYKKLLKK